MVLDGAAVDSAGGAVLFYPEIFGSLVLAKMATDQQVFLTSPYA